MPPPLPRASLQALLLKLFAPSPAGRPADMKTVLQHPFFTRVETFAATSLVEKAAEEGDEAKTLKNHVFLSHFQGNAVRVLFAAAASAPQSASWWRAGAAALAPLLAGPSCCC